VSTAQSPSVRIEKVDLASAEHAHAVLALLDHYASDAMGGGQPLSAYARAHLIAALRARPEYVGLLAFEGGLAVGLANCFEGFSTFAAKPLLNIHDLVVHVSARGRGVAQALLQRSEDEARARGACKLTLEVLSLNHKALASYGRFGFRAYALDPDAGGALFLEKKLAQ
jgi:GNAT superfamily N-acetyltransferase